MRGADDKPCWAFLSRLSHWVEVDKNRWRMQDLVLGNGYSDKEMDR